MEIVLYSNNLSQLAITGSGLWLVRQLVRRVLFYYDWQDFLRTQAQSIISHIT